MNREWLRATLAEKVTRRAQSQGPESLRRLLAREAGDLRVDWEFSAPQEWLVIRARGEDADAFLNLLRDRFGEVPVEGSRVERWDVLQGFLVGAGRVGFGVYVDIGVVEPVRRDALFPLHRMRAQLADGAVLSCRQILEENGLADDLPVKVLVTDVEGDRFSVELADVTREMFLSWRRFPFDRVIVLGATRDIVERAVKSMGLDRDVIMIQPLSLFAHCLVCKIGTDAPGVIAIIGKRLRGVGLVSYRAKINPLTLAR